MPLGLVKLYEFLSDLTLGILILCFIGFAADTWSAARVNGKAIVAFSHFMIALAIFFSWFALVYLDRRFNVWPWGDLQAAMGYRWYWPFRLLLIIFAARLWLALRAKH